MQQHHVKTFQHHLQHLVLAGQQTHVVAHYVGLFLEVEDEVWLAGMRQVGENEADLSADVVGIGFEQFQNLLE